MTAAGKVFAFGDAPNDGDMSGTHLNGSIVAASGSWSRPAPSAVD